MEKIQKEELHKYSSQNSVSGQFRNVKFPGRLPRMGAMRNEYILIEMCGM
jgi:hypothetical protein